MWKNYGILINGEIAKSVKSMANNFSLWKNTTLSDTRQVQYLYVSANKPLLNDFNLIAQEWDTFRAYPVNVTKVL